MNSPAISVGLHSHSRRHAFKSDPAYTIQTFLEEAASWGFESTEMMTGKAGGPPDHIGTDDPARLQAICQQASRNGTPVSCFSTYNDFAFTRDEAWRQANIEYIEKWTRFAGQCGVPNIRLLTGYRVEGESDERLEALIIEGIRRCARLAETEGVNLALENHSTLFLDATDIDRLCKAVNSDRLTTCPDPTNGFGKFDAETPQETRDAMLENLRRLALKATNAHLKVWDAAFTHFPLDEMLAIYDETNYVGAIQLELIDAEAPVSTLIEAAKTLRQAIAEREKVS